MIDSGWVQLGTQAGCGWPPGRDVTDEGPPDDGQACTWLCVGGQVGFHGFCNAYGSVRRWQRWNDRDSEYAQAETQKLTRANKKRAAQSRSYSHRIAAYFDDHFFEVDQHPTVIEVAAEFGVSKKNRSEGCGQGRD